MMILRVHVPVCCVPNARAISITERGTSRIPVAVLTMITKMAEQDDQDDLRLELESQVDGDHRDEHRDRHREGRAHDADRRRRPSLRTSERARPMGTPSAARDQERERGDARASRASPRAMSPSRISCEEVREHLRRRDDGDERAASPDHLPQRRRRSRWTAPTGPALPRSTCRRPAAWLRLAGGSMAASGVVAIAYTCPMRPRGRPKLALRPLQDLVHQTAIAMIRRTSA